MDLQKEREAFEASNNVNPDWSFKFDEELQQYIALDSEMELQVDEFNELWDAFRAGWQAAKAQASKQFENFIDQAIEDSACADERRSLQALLDEFQNIVLIEARESANESE